MRGRKEEGYGEMRQGELEDGRRRIAAEWLRDALGTGSRGTR